MHRTVPLLALLFGTPAFAGAIGQTSTGNATATVILSATLNTSTAVEITGLGTCDPFGNDTGNQATVSLGALSLAAPPAGADPCTGFVVHSDIGSPDPEDDSLTVFLQLDIVATLTGIDQGSVVISGTGPTPTTESTARWVCNPGASPWGSATTYIPAGSALDPVGTECAPLAASGDTPITADFALHVRATETQTALSGTFITTVIPGP